jgi:site-specific DNA recombinase
LIYTRFSCDRQSEKSNADQEREVRAMLRRMGIDDSDAIVIHDQAESATTNDRPGFVKMFQLIGEGLVFLVAVDDQTRASSGDDVTGVVRDMVYHATRFISGDGVDTDERGWEFNVRLLGIHNATCLYETARRVRRGMRGRVLEHKSAGDYCYGYISDFEDPQYAANWTGRRPKPAKCIVIYEPHAKWVRLVFLWVAESASIGEVARRMQAGKAPIGRNMKRWTAKVVSRLVRNYKKYAGQEWSWGATKIIRDS